MSNDTQADQEPHLAEIVSGIVSDAQDLVKHQLALFKTEIQQDLRKTREAALPLVCGVLASGLGAVLLALAIVHVLAWAFPVLPLWCCYGLVGTALVAGGRVLILQGKARFDAFNPLPDQSAEALKENVQWFMEPK